ncbi:TOMM system kinase/cyclase fusion protein [Sorangium sp. So ce406]|uniref:TOMM system kinase/cyclase fusion protein n=1 Tax=Sorangium sp. So ce406 TaxID=3133311 RepID=UPI003F5CAD2F
MDSRQKIGAVLGDRYEILAELGEGGFGTIYKARQLATGQFVAIKVLQLGSSGAAQAREKRVARFQLEMQLCGQLHHPNIVRLIDSGQADEAVVYSVFEFVPGKDLAHILAEEGPLDAREARHFMLQILDALGCAHAQGVIHRDLKPANLMIIPTGARRNVLVLDLGIGALTEEAKREQKTRITLSNESVGTPAYAAPEQLRGQPPTPRSDLYAWGLVFLECLTGKRVIAGDTAADVIFNQLSADPVPIPAILLDHPLGDILRRATAKDAAARNVTTEGLLRELEECDVSGLRSRSAPARLQPAAPDMRTDTVELARQSSGGALSSRLVEGERRQITAVCCSLAASSTAHGPVDTEELDQLLGLQQEACTMIARRFNGHVAGVLGDSVLFYFGYPTAREDAARRAAEAARQMAADLVRRRKALEAERKTRIDLRIGIHTGLVIARELRDPTIAGLGYIVGTTPKIAAWLSAAAEPGSILVSGETQRLLRKHFALEEDGTRSLEGFETPVEVFRLQEGNVSGGLRDTPLVGRARELEILLERWGRARGGAGQAVLITGEPGIGKSRLARELEEKSRDEPHTWLESRCTPDSANSAFYPIVDLLGRMLDPQREAKADEKVSQLEALLSRYGFDLGEAMPLFAPLLSLPLPARWAPLDVSPQKKRELTRGAVLSLFFEMAEKAPIVLAIEDLHWADPSTMELLVQLVGEVGSARVMALFTARPEFSPSWPSTAVVAVQLSRFGRAEVELMAAKITGGRALPGEALEAITSRTDGVPLFVEELVLTMLEAGALVERDGGYELAKPLSEVAIPSTLRDLLVARLDRLRRAKETAQVASAIGREFTFELLRAVSPLDEAAAQEDLDKLVAAELVFRRRRIKGAAYIFKHALVRDAAYQSMLKRSRVEVHARIARALEEKLPEVVAHGAVEMSEASQVGSPDAGRFYSSLAHHWSRAEVLDKAVRYFVRAGEHAKAVYANEEAIGFYRAAIGQLHEFLGAQGADAGEWRDALRQTHESLGDVLTLAGRQEEARRSYDDALARWPEGERVRRANLHRKIGKTWETHHQHEQALLSHQRAEAALGEAPAGQDDEWWRAWVQIQLDQAWVYYWLARVPEMIALADKVRPVIDERGTPMQRAKFFQALVYTSFRRDRYMVPEETVRYARAARDAAATTRDLGEHALMQFGLAASLLFHDVLGEAEREMNEAVRLSKQVGNVALLSRALTYLAITYRRLRGHAADVERCAAESLTVAMTGNMIEYIGTARANQAWLAWGQGDTRSVEANGQAALDLWSKLSLVYPFQWAALFPVLAVELAGGRLSEAVQRACALVKPTQQRLPAALTAALEQGAGAWERGDEGTTRAELARGIELAEQFGYL